MDKRNDMIPNKSSPILQWYKKSIDKKIIIVFDTNVLLDMYYIKLEDLKDWGYYIDSIKEHIWTPYQVYLEFKENRRDKIYQIQDRINDLLKFKNMIGKQCDNFFKKYEDFPFEYGKVIGEMTKNRMKGIDQYIYYYEDILKELKKNTGKLTYEKKDDYFKLIKDKIFSDLGAKYDEKTLQEIYEEADFRFKNNIPPGYVDNRKKNSNKYGDYIIWKQMIEKSKTEKKDIIFVSNDKKPDWRKNGVCRQELVKEFQEVTGNQFMLLDLDGLIKYTTTSSKNVEECIYDVRASYNGNIVSYSIWNKKFAYYETIDNLLTQRRNEYMFFKGTDDIAFSQLKLFREIIEYTVSTMVCGKIYMPRYALTMDVWIRKGELIEPFCNVYYKANNCLTIGLNRGDVFYPIVKENENKKCKTGYIHEMVYLTLSLAYQEGYLSDNEIDLAESILKSLYTEDEFNNL